MNYSVSEKLKEKQITLEDIHELCIDYNRIILNEENHSEINSKKPYFKNIYKHTFNIYLFLIQFTDFEKSKTFFDEYDA